MGTVGGAQDWLTGRDTPLEVKAPYEEWLLERIVKYGVNAPIAGNLWNASDYHYNATASVLNHTILTFEGANGAGVFRITPKAKRYIELMENENE